MEPPRIISARGVATLARLDRVSAITVGREILKNRNRNPITQPIIRGLVAMPFRMLEIFTEPPRKISISVTVRILNMGIMTAIRIAAEAAAVSP